MNDVKKTIRYMGNKNKLLDFIVPEIIKQTKKGDIICDIMAGTNSVTYALKGKRCVYANDIQFYSYIISLGLIGNNKETISSDSAISDLEKNYDINFSEKEYCFFEKNYADTYFSLSQCIEIDSIRYAIEKIKNSSKQALYLISLMYAMNLCQSTSGHFAQYLPKDHKRLTDIRKRSIWDAFIKKCDDFSSIVVNSYDNKCFNLDYDVLINSPEFDKVSLVYVDPPYTGEQYSRFYHVLETVCKYDSPNLEHKGLYRNDRFMSGFSSKLHVKKEFDKLLKLLAEKNRKVVISYSTRGLIEDYELERIISKYYKNCKTKRIDYNHSTQGKGNIHLEELLFIAYN